MKPQSMEEKISYRLFFMGFVGLVCTAVLCLFVFHKAFREQAWTSLEHQADLVSAGYEQLSSPDQLSVFVNGDLRITLIAADGSVVFESATDQQMENHLSRPEIQQAMREGVGRNCRDSQTMGYETYYYAMLLPGGDILQLSHLDSVSETHAQPDMETVDLLDVAKDCVERQKLNAQRSFISLTYLGESARVLGNRDQLDELCQNLCDNAIRYNRPGGKVQLITSCTRDGHCTLTVKDNGIGIPKDAQSSVFERFYRVDKSRSKATGGTGLGLAIVKHIARIHNARIKLESEVNVGTTITIVFETAH